MPSVAAYAFDRSARPHGMRVKIVTHRNPQARAGHEFATLEALARRLARLHGYDYAGVHNAPRSDGPAYFVPENSLLCSEADALGIRSADDLFGGVVPHRFVATKVISHPVLEEATHLPQGWSLDLPDRMSGAVLPGYAVFSRRDARQAGMRLLDAGTVRLKLAQGSGGNGQFLVASASELDNALTRISEEEFPRHGATVEQHLHRATTCSIGTVDCAGIRMTYVGVQRTTRNREGTEAYGGSDLVVVRGGFDALRKLGLDNELERAVAQAQQYHAAVEAAYPSFFASRCNYDVLQGYDRDEHWQSGVLEQSWRLGGATPAELAALEAFACDPALDGVRASSHEVHGEHEPPPGAIVHYRDVDPRWGLITKYSTVERNGHPA